MEVIFQLLDVDYIMLNEKPVVRVFGKTIDGKPICVFYDKHQPYFYILPKEGKFEEVVEFLKDEFLNLITNIRKVRKFLPIGFQKEKTEMLVVYLKDPSKVPSVRDRLKKHPAVKETFEADILFKYRFMADLGLSGMKWYKAIGKTTNTNSVTTTIKMKAEKFEEVDVEKDADLKYLSVDIEVVPGKEGIPDPKNDKIVIISLAFYPSFNRKDSLVLTLKNGGILNEKVMTFKDEKEMLRKFVEIVKRYDPDVIVGYNIDNFDIPFIVERLRINKVSRAIGRCNQKPIVCRKVGHIYRNSITGRVIADVFTLIKEAVGKGILRLKRYGLGDVSEELLGERKVDITHSEISKYWNGDRKKVEKLLEYAERDAVLALKLLVQRQMLDKFIAISKVTGILLQDSLHCSESIRIENLLLKEFNKRDFVIPNKPTNEEIRRRKEEREHKGLKGALVLQPITGLHTNCVTYLDFRSLYPSIYYAFNICPTTWVKEEVNVETIKTPYGTKFVSKKVRKGIISELVYDLIEKRAKVKEEMKKETDPERKRVLFAKQLALKYVANAFYGYTGYLRARFYVLEIANAITSCGRDILQKTKKHIEEELGLKVIYGDTDSFMLETKTTDVEEAERIGMKAVELINSRFKGVIKVKIEGIFKTFLILTKKRYAGWMFERSNGRWKDKIITKGIETVRRDWCDLVSETLYNVLEIILKEQNPKKAAQYVRNVMKELQEGKIPLEKLVIIKGISKPLHSYKGIQPHVELVKKMIKRDPASAPGVGDRIGFVIVKGTQLVSKRAEDPEYVKKNNLQIDSRYYIENQVLPPLERVFEAMNITKSQLVGFGKQLALFDVIKERKEEKGIEDVLNAVQGLICAKCETTYRRVPLQGKCTSCGGELLFYFNDRRSRFFIPT